MSGHPSSELLARYAEGDLGRRRTSRVRAHLISCPACAAVLADLSRVTETLASAPAPVLPGAIAGRLDAALAAAIAERSGAARRSEVPARQDLPAGRRPRGRSGRARPRRGSWSPNLVRGLAVAGAVAVLAGGGLVISRLAASPASRSAAGSGVAAGSNAGPHANSAAANGSGTAAPAQEPGPRPQPAAGRASSAMITLPYQRGGAPATTAVIISDVDLTPASLAAAVRQAVFQASASRPAPSASPGAPRSAYGSPGGLELARLSGCVTNVAAGSRVVVVEVARYLGRSATVIVTAASPPATGWRATIVGPGCSAASPAFIARTLVGTQG